MLRASTLHHHRPFRISTIHHHLRISFSIVVSSSIQKRNISIHYRRRVFHRLLLRLLLLSGARWVLRNPWLRRSKESRPPCRRRWSPHWRRSGLRFVNCRLIKTNYAKKKKKWFFFLVIRLQYITMGGWLRSKDGDLIQRMIIKTVVETLFLLLSSLVLPM